jgi:hypothetical protein
MPYLARFDTVWESAAGDGDLARGLIKLGCEDVITSDISAGQDFFCETPPPAYDVQVTNPPYSIKYKWLKRSYELNKPFALLLPLETLGARQAQDLFERHGFELMLLSSRVNFKMPTLGYAGHGAQFPVAWFCWKILPRPITYGNLDEPKKAFTRSKI